MNHNVLLSVKVGSSARCNKVGIQAVRCGAVVVSVLVSNQFWHTSTPKCLFVVQCGVKQAFTPLGWMDG